MTPEQRKIHEELVAKWKLYRDIANFYFDNVIHDGLYNTLIKPSPMSDYISFNPIDNVRCGAYLVIKVTQIKELKVLVESIEIKPDNDINERLKQFNIKVLEIAKNYMEKNQ